jgi:hypothetical protein
MANLVYRKSSTPSANVITTFKGSPLTNDELDNNLFGIDAEVQTKAPINNAVFTGSTTIPNIIATGGSINSVTIGSTGQSTGSFTTLTSSGNAAINGGSITSTATTFNLVNATATTVNFAGAGTAVTIGNTTGLTTIRHSAAITGDFTVNTNKFTVNATSGNTLVAGTLGVTGTTTLAAATVANTLGVTGDFTVNTNKFTVNATTGDAVHAGTLGVTGATTLSSTLGVVGNLAVNTNKFNVTATTGDTTIAGTLGVTGVSTLNSLTVTNGATVGTTLGVTGAATFSSNVTLSGSTVAATDYFRITDGAGSPVTKFLVDSASGNTTISGTLGVTGATTLTDATLSGDIAVNGGDITTTATTFNLIDTTATTLNIGRAGTAITIGALTGTTTVRNTLSVTGGVTFGGNLGVTGDFAVNTNKFNVTAATGNTLVAGTLGVTGATTLTTLGATTISATSLTTTAAVSGSTLVSTVAIGTAPLTVTSTTKVVNLQADSVDGMNFGAVNTGGVIGTDQIGGVAYAIDSSNITYVPPGTSGKLLQSNGLGQPPTWVVPSGLTAGSSATAANISGGVAGQLLYQGAVDTTNKLNIGTANTVLTSSGTAPQWSNSLSLAGTLGVTGVSTLASAVVTTSATVGTTLGVTGAVTLSSSLGVTGVSTLNSAIVTTSATVGTTLGVTGATTLSNTLNVTGVSTLNSLVVTNGATVGTTLGVTGNTTLTGTLTHGGLTPSAGTNVDQLYTATDAALVVTTSWVSTSVNFAELATGSYMVQVNTGTEYYTGIMSWYSADINSAVTDEIILHRASAGTETSNLFLRIERTDVDVDPSSVASLNMTLQISSSVTRVSASYTYKFRRMI